MCSKISVIQHKFCRYQYYRYGYIGTDTDTDINIGAPIIHIYTLNKFLSLRIYATCLKKFVNALLTSVIVRGALLAYYQNCLSI